MKAKEILTSPFFVAAPDTLVRDIVDLRVRKRISGVPVAEEGAVIGVIDEGDRTIPEKCLHVRCSQRSSHRGPAQRTSRRHRRPRPM
jgi:predicted transcriptional regulator